MIFENLALSECTVKRDDAGELDVLSYHRCQWHFERRKPGNQSNPVGFCEWCRKLCTIEHDPCVSDHTQLDHNCTTWLDDRGREQMHPTEERVTISIRWCKVTSAAWGMTSLTRLRVKLLYKCSWRFAGFLDIVGNLIALSTRVRKLISSWKTYRKIYRRTPELTLAMSAQFNEETSWARILSSAVMQIKRELEKHCTRRLVMSAVTSTVFIQAEQKLDSFGYSRKLILEA